MLTAKRGAREGSGSGRDALYDEGGPPPDMRAPPPWVICLPSHTLTTPNEGMSVMSNRMLLRIKNAGDVAKSIAALVVLASLIVAGLAFFARARDLHTVEDRVVMFERRYDIDILEDRKWKIQEQLWSLESEYGAGCESAPLSVAKVCAELDRELDNIILKLKALREGGGPT